MSDDKSTNATNTTFEEELARLESCVEQLEGGELTLEEAIAQFETGFKAWKGCAERLDVARRRIEVLCGDTDDVAEGESLEWRAMRADELGDVGADPEGHGDTGEDAEAAERTRPQGGEQ